jgi:hypothetical protein
MYRKPVGLLLGPDTIVNSQQVLIEEITDGFD